MRRGGEPTYLNTEDARIFGASVNGVLTHFDFDCCGFGVRVFELATFKWGIFYDDNGRELWPVFLEAYRLVREVGAEDLALVDVFVTIRQIWWMAFIVGNASDFGYCDASEEFVAAQLGSAIRMLQVALGDELQVE